MDKSNPGGAPRSFDKQFLRYFLETLVWGKTAPAPALPEEILRKTGEKYEEALFRLTGIKI
jgi:phosphoribosylaminoimidazole-succinocarboxamide synthase